ncbi:MAG: copper chaperone PCu(A)C [Candidatus Competibacteraceae bacterium]|nr:copper chaperone PCu(A)C [Candidatus Competibacteraceae bacterium]MBK7984840.1 copper chaperone PCu(A)C [Candidatus Competibacteraceae bacterium]MBK8899396.1 copper chaperone PCu(A)C [Candidatus Competibacteraceae bacterium]MBK8964401.1 copper chaperone PCu(A)C [Candidatus Competibacteraceae bacterium]MBK9952389.1 copper chaperone PCu(A)C [Candidatus Competibacteraceae bacterium]
MKRFLFSLLLTCSALVQAAGNNAVQIVKPQAAETPPGAKTGAVYFDVVNSGGADRLLSAEAKEMAGTLELHTTQMEGTMMKMRQVDAVDLAAGETTSLKPGGLHVMLIDLKKPLQAGQSFPLTLHLEKAGTLQVTVPVVKREAMMDAMPQHDQGHSGHAKP